MTKQNEMLPLTSAAAQLNSTPLNVLMHIKRGLLHGVEENGSWLVDPASLAALLAKTGGGKAEDVCANGCTKKHACGGDCG